MPPRDYAMRRPVQSYNLIIKLSKEGKISQYYDSEREIFLRHVKKAFISFVPKALTERIREKKRLSINSIQKKVKEE
jgi:hypothetical protein